MKALKILKRKMSNDGIRPFRRRCVHPVPLSLQGRIGSAGRGCGLHPFQLEPRMI